MFKSIFSRLFWNNIVIISTSLLAFLLTLLVLFNDYINDVQFKTDMKAAKNIQDMTIFLQIENSDRRNYGIYSNMVSQYSKFTESDIVVVNSVGEVYVTTKNIKSVPEEYNKQILNGKVLRLRSDFGDVYEKKVYVVGVPMEYRGVVVGGIYFNTHIPSLRGKFREYTLMFLISAILSVLIGCIISYIQSRRITKPIKEINSGVLEIASGDFSKRIVADYDEIGQLASSFNYMADSLEKLEKSRAGFISDISHELRTPMTSISGFIGGILDGTIPKEKQDEYLKIAYDESVRLTRLTNDMLEMSKMQSAEYKISPVSFDINELIRVCIIQLENKIDAKNLDIEAEFEKDKLNVFADKDSIKRVIINILDNAIKFSYNNTKIKIKSGIHDKKAYVSIGNFGAGINNTDMSNIFERFYKTDKSRSEDKKGAGLGLSLVKNILNLHNQNIWVESIDTKAGSDAKFTKFTFTLELS